jgi:hypothetical protein
MVADFIISVNQNDATDYGYDLRRLSFVVGSLITPQNGDTTDALDQAAETVIVSAALKKTTCHYYQCQVFQGRHRPALKWSSAIIRRPPDSFVAIKHTRIARSLSLTLYSYF